VRNDDGRAEDGGWNFLPQYSVFRSPYGSDKERKLCRDHEGEFEKDEKYAGFPERANRDSVNLLIPYSDDFNGRNGLSSVSRPRFLNICQWLSWSWFGPTPFCFNVTKGRLLLKSNLH